MKAKKTTEPKTLTLWLATQASPEQTYRWGVFMRRPMRMAGGIWDWWVHNATDGVGAYSFCDRGRRIFEALTGFAFPAPGECRKVVVRTRRVK